jgi:hypothetical protein
MSSTTLLGIAKLLQQVSRRLLQGLCLLVLLLLILSQISGLLWNFSVPIISIAIGIVLGLTFVCLLLSQLLMAVRKSR